MKDRTCICHHGPDSEGKEIIWLLLIANEKMRGSTCTYAFSGLQAIWKQERVSCSCMCVAGVMFIYVFGKMGSTYKEEASKWKSHIHTGLDMDVSRINMHTWHTKLACSDIRSAHTCTASYSYFASVDTWIYAASARGRTRRRQEKNRKERVQLQYLRKEYFIINWPSYTRKLKDFDGVHTWRKGKLDGLGLYVKTNRRT